MGEKYLIDSNSAIDFLMQNLPSNGMKFVAEVVDVQPTISVINKMELLGYNATGKDEKSLKEFVDVSSVIGLSDEVVDQTIRIRKTKRIKLPDAVIAATALVHELILISRNEKDFIGIPKLKLINPHKL